MERSEVLTTASGLITGDRKADYGDARESFGRIADLWSAYLGVNVIAAQVPVLMVLLKVSRAVESSDKADTYVDMAGYAALAAELTDAA